MGRRFQNKLKKIMAEKYGYQKEKEFTFMTNLRGITVTSDLMKPIETIPVYNQRELTTYLQTLGGEARGEDGLGIQAVAGVILNRWRQQKEYFGKTVQEVCTKATDGLPQFACWYPDNPNLEWMQKPDVYSWEKVFKYGIKEYLGLAQFWSERNVCYFKRVDSLDGGFWNRLNHVQTIGNHDFYADPNLPSFIK